MTASEPMGVGQIRCSQCRRYVGVAVAERRDGEMIVWVDRHEIGSHECGDPLA